MLKTKQLLERAVVKRSWQKGLVPSRSAVTLTAISACVVGVPLIVYSYKCLMMVLFQSKLIYMPYLPLGARDPESWKETFKESQLHIKGWKFRPYLLKYESDLNSFSWLKHKVFRGVNLRGFLLENSSSVGSPEVNVIYFQGNAGNMYHRKDLFEGLLKQGDVLGIKLRVIAIHLRGYGDSSGSSSQKILEEDSKHILEEIRREYAGARTAIYGHSLGGAVAINLACVAAKHLDGLVLENTFTSIHDMVSSMYPAWLPYRYLARVFLKSPWDSLGSINRLQAPIHCPILLLASQKDDVVPHTMMQELYKALTLNQRSSIYGSPYWKSLSYGYHDYAYQQPGFWKAWQDFLKKIITPY
ncbi:hypothetical protein DSO57_1012586 [Entomophthora muscae]|uniref:Uncharacterized protein n=1 Tax=Entomophthora muscae TaxID=34485 RepID=A0ACC2UQZ2_9FUNG|nr:hypothetical protein DSO57_1012586 [Entomophthora muscae]